MFDRRLLLIVLTLCTALTACGSGHQDQKKPAADQHAVAARAAMRGWVRATTPRAMCSQLTRSFLLFLSDNRPASCPRKVVKKLDTLASRPGDVVKITKVAPYKGQEIVTAIITAGHSRSVRVSTTYFFAPEGGGWKLNTIGQYHKSDLSPETP